MASLKNTLAFDPRSISGCQVWLDGADSSTFTLSGTNVTQWRDKSGQSNHANAPTVNYPTVTTNSLNNQATVSFLGNSDVLLVSNNFTTTTFPSLCYFIVINPGSTQPNTSYAGILSTDTAGAFGRTLGFGGGSWQQEYYNGFTNITPYTANTWTLASLQFTTTVSATLAVNGRTFAGTASGTGTNTSGLKIGSYNSGDAPINYGQYNANFQVAEILVYGANLTTSQRQQIEGYLAWKWGLTGNLPATHPFKQPIVPFSYPLQKTTMRFTQTFDPRSISGLQLWLDPTSFSTFTNGQAISQWVDKSSNAFVGTAINSPTYQTNVLNGLPVIRFNGTNQYINFGNILNLGTNSLTIFFVSRFLINPGNQVGVIGKSSYRANAGRWAMSYDTVAAGPNGIGVYIFIDDTNQSLTAFTHNPSLNFGIYCGQNNRTSSNTIYLDGVLRGQQTFSASANNLNNTDPLYIASYPDGTGSGPQAGMFMNGDMAEILVYFAHLSTAQRQQVEGYLARKWGLSANLASTHPNRNPLTVAPFPHAISRVSVKSAKWAPTRITGCLLWLDANDPNGNGTLVSNGTVLTRWVDKSGSNNTLTANGSPVYTNYNSRNAIFINSNHLSNASSMAVANTTIFFVLSISTPINDKSYFQMGANPNSGGGDTTTFFSDVNVTRPGGNGTGRLYYGDGGGNQMSISFPTATSADVVPYFIQTAKITSAPVVQNYVNSALSNSKTGTVARVNQTGVIVGSSNGGWQWTGYFSEVIIFNTALSVANQQMVEGYLAWKWGLQANLPSTHPYAKFPPTP